MLTTESTTRHTANSLGGTFDAASRLCEAWEWLETQRRNAPEGADVWDIRWQAKKSATYLTNLLHTLQAGQYRLSPLQLHGQGDDRKAVWGAQDALVLKWVALSIEDRLPLHPACEHVKGHGGGKQSVDRLHALLTGTAPEQTTGTQETTGTTSPKKTADYTRVCRTDIRGYYRNISKATLLNHVRQHVQDPVLTALIHQYVHYTVEDSGTFHTPEKGISRGCPLSPLMGALHLYDMDEHFSRQKDIHYARYMDDIIILAKTRWSLRKHTKRLMQWFSDYGFEAHPDKTQFGRTAKGFDWMGAWLADEGVTDIAPRAKANHREKVRRLYERLARVPNWLRHRRQQQVHARVSAYRKRWNIWANGTVWVSLALAAPPSTAGVTPITELTVQGFPSIVTSDVTSVPTSLGAGALVWQTPSDVQSSTVTIQYNGFGAIDNATMQKATRVLNGVAYILPYSNCPSIGLKINILSFHGYEKGNPGYGYRGTKDNPPDSPTATVFNIPGGDYLSWGPTAVVDLAQASGTWTLLDSVDSPYYQCTPSTGEILTYGVSATSFIATTPNGIKYMSGNAWGVRGQATVSPPPPVYRPACAFNAPTGLTTQTLTADITPNQINKQTNSHVIAKFPSSIGLTVSCTGDMTGVKPIVELAWTKSASLGGSGGLRIGVANDVDDTSNGILLSTKDSAVGATGDCGTVPEGYDMCGAYPINPATGLTLYPVLFRNTFNNAGNAKSGVHTVTGTLKVVIP